MELNLNPIVKQLLTVIGKFFLFTIITIIVGSISMLLIALTGDRDEFLTALTSELTLATIGYQIVYYVGITIGIMVAIYTIFTLIEKRPSFFKLHSLRQKLIEFSIGSTWGIGIISTIVAILWIFGFVQIESFHWNGSMLIKFLLFFFIAALVEELIFRTFTINLVGTAFGLKTALILSAVLFTWIHHNNPSLDILPLLNLLLGGFVLGLLYIKYNQIWCPLGFHLTWNFFQGTVFGFEVSGLYSESILTISRSGSHVLTGGEFGLEGSILSVLGLVLVIIFYKDDWKKIKDHRSLFIENKDNIA